MWFIQLLKIKLILETKKELMGLIFDVSMEAMIMGALGGLRRVWGPHIHLHAVDHWGIPGEVPSHWTTNFLFSVAPIKTCRDSLPHQISIPLQQVESCQRWKQSSFLFYRNMYHYKHLWLQRKWDINQCDNKACSYNILPVVRSCWGGKAERDSWEFVKADNSDEILTW